jgi:hypothetical protein
MVESFDAPSGSAVNGQWSPMACSSSMVVTDNAAVEFQVQAPDEFQSPITSGASR